MNLKELTTQALETKASYEAWEQKESKKSWEIEEVYQALVSDIGDLGRLVLAKEGFRDMPDADASLAHEFSEILYATLLLSNHYGVDLEKSFIAEMKKQRDNLD